MGVIRQKHFGHPQMFGLATLLIIVNLLSYVTIVHTQVCDRNGYFSIFLK